MHGKQIYLYLCTHLRSMAKETKRTRVLSLSIIQKAIEALDKVALDHTMLSDNAVKYGTKKLVDHYKDTVEALLYLFNKEKNNLQRMSDLYILSERLLRIIDPKIYLNAYIDKRSSEAVYVNANVGFINSKGKVENVVVFMGKDPSGDLEKAKERIANDIEFNDLAKRKVIERLMSNIEIPLREFNGELLNNQLKLVFSKENNNVIKEMDNFITTYNDNLFNGKRQTVTLTESIILMERLLTSVKTENKQY